MMTALDNRTLLLIAGSLYVLLPLSAWLVLRWPRQAAPMVWAAGGVVGGVGLLLIGLRGQIPDLLSYALGHPLLALGAALVAQSLRMDMERPWPWSWLAGLTLLYAACLAMSVTWWQASPMWLGVLTRAVNLSVVVLLISSAWRVGQRERSRNAKTLAGVYVVQALGIGANLLTALQGSDDIQTLAAHPVSVSVSLLTLLVALTASMAYLGLALERSVRDQLALARSQTRLQQWQSRRDALVAFDRERLMAMLADSLGHTITQPLTAALVHLQMAQRQLRAAEPDATWLRQNLDLMTGQLNRTSATVEQVRRWVRPPGSEHSRVDIAQLMQEVEQLMYQEAINRRVPIDWQALPEPLWVVGDRLQLAQALVQMLRNALQATAGSAAPLIRIGVSAGPDQIEWQVEDNGPGLPGALSAERLNSDANTMASLEGIGLFVVQSIARGHGGSLQLGRSGLGGACVTLRLPRAADSAV